MRIVTTPTESWLDEEIGYCRSRLIIASPYVGHPLSAFVRRVPRRVRRVVLTQTELRVFAFGASDLGALYDAATAGATVLGLAGLHAKVYVIDRRAALVSSANATPSGLRRNWECGLAVYDGDTVERLAELALSGFGSAVSPDRWTPAQLRALIQPVRALESAIAAARVPLASLLKSRAGRPTTAKDKEALRAGAGGWTALTLEGIADLRKQEFALDELLRASLPKAEQRYPRNRFVREQLRKQLQLLRNQGLVEFLGAGHYRFLPVGALGHPGT